MIVLLHVSPGIVPGRETIINCSIQRDLNNHFTLGAIGAGISVIRDGAHQSGVVAYANYFANWGNDLNHPVCDTVQHTQQILSLVCNFIAHKDVKHIAIFAIAVCPGLKS